MHNTNCNLKILIPILTIGKQGGFRVLSKLANHWSNMGYNVEVVSYYENKLPYFPIKTKIHWIDDEGNEEPMNIDEFDIRNSGYKRTRSLYKFLKKHSKKLIECRGLIIE